LRVVQLFDKHLSVGRAIKLHSDRNTDLFYVVFTSVASLGWVSPGAATDGVTPIISLKKN